MGLAAAAAVVGVTSLTGLGVASAQSSDTSDGATGIVQKIAKKFNLSESDVKAVFDEDRASHQAEQKQKVEERLTQAVIDGKITEDQKQKILAKISEIETQREANRDSMKDKTDAERKAAMDAQKTALEAWAKENNIPDDYMRMLHMGGGHGGPGGLRGEKPPEDSTQTN